MGADATADPGPHREEDALAFVVTGAVLVGFAEISQRDRTIDGRHDLTEGDLVRSAGEGVATPHAALGMHDARPLQGEEDLFEVGLREARSLRDIAHRGGAGLVGVQGQGDKCSAGVITPGGDFHRRNPRAAGRGHGTV